MKRFVARIFVFSANKVKCKKINVGRHTAEHESGLNKNLRAAIFDRVWDCSQQAIFACGAPRAQLAKVNFKAEKRKFQGSRTNSAPLTSEVSLPNSINTVRSFSPIYCS